MDLLRIITIKSKSQSPKVNNLFPCYFHFSSPNLHPQENEWTKKHEPDWTLSELNPTSRKCALTRIIVHHQINYTKQFSHPFHRPTPRNHSFSSNNKKWSTPFNDTITSTPERQSSSPQPSPAPNRHNLNVQQVNTSSRRTRFPDKRARDYSGIGLTAMTRREGRSWWSGC